MELNPFLHLPPGFRFHPTDEELITHYLSPKTLASASFSSHVITDVDLNKVEPWDLPWKAKMGEKEWYFFCVRDRKYPTGSRTNRATEAGYWKATGKDREIFREKTLVGMKKTLVFYGGRAPKGAKTNWVMHEYRLEGKRSLPRNLRKNEWVICRVFKKSSGGKKVHISCLRPGGPSSQQSIHLPPLMDMSIDDDRARSDHVTSFSNSVEETRLDKFSPSSGHSALSPDQIVPRPNMHDQSELRMMLLNTSNPYLSQNVDMSSLNYPMVCSKFFENHHQEFPGQVELDCLWNY